MNKVRLFAAASIASAAIAALVASPAFAWHPQGKIQKSVQNSTTNSQSSDANDTASAVSVHPGDIVKYTVTVSNAAQPAANNDNDMAFVKLTDNLPTGVELVSNASQRQITEDLGTIVPGKSVTKEYQVKVTSQKDGDVITNNACFTGNSIVKDNPQSGCDTAVIKVSVPSYTCDLLSVTKGNNRTVTIADFKQSAKNAIFQNVVVNWGDNTAPLTSAAPTNQTHQYAADGTYTVSATAHFTVDGQDKTATSTSCSASVSFTTTSTPPASTPPAELPNTGAGNIIVPALLASLAGYGLYFLNLKRRALN